MKNNVNMNIYIEDFIMLSKKTLILIFGYKHIFTKIGYFFKRPLWILGLSMLDLRNLAENHQKSEKSSPISRHEHPVYRIGESGFSNGKTFKKHFMSTSKCFSVLSLLFFLILSKCFFRIIVITIFFLLIIGLRRFRSYVLCWHYVSNMNSADNCLGCLSAIDHETVYVLWWDKQ